ncbi:MAG: Na+/H+ antiporter subunit E [Defluviitaleaceae bacterium]|nr:Na+/H+ antiporter subunit E [Defluviitaleaceae bacterium]
MKRIIFLTTALTIVWVILMESFSWQNIAIGVILGIIISRFSSKYLPNTKERAEDIERIKFYKLITYPFWLIGKAFKDAFFIMRLIVTDGAKCNIVKEQLGLDNEVLRTILADSVTLTPGTICLELNDKEITILYMSDGKTSGLSGVNENLRSIEKKLQKAEAGE